jgi:glycosyltransferase involved in cell wall biosynthesis
MHSAHSDAVHLVNPLSDAHGGSEWRAVDTFRLLEPHSSAHVWSEQAPHARFRSALPVERIAPWRLGLPRGGTLVFVGVYFRIGHWVRFASPRRVVVLYNTSQDDRLRKNLARIAASGVTAEVVYTSAALRQRERGHGPVLESPIDVARFPYRPRHGGRPFTVGRLSRDMPTKHHAEDALLWRELAASGIRVRLMGATCLARELAGVPNVELLPAGAEDASAFLHSLDCFVYRTADTWFEAFGRVVFEAMATGLPVVCGDRGGYVDSLDDGNDALVFSSTARALDAVLALQRDPARARALGGQAHATVARQQRDLAARTVAMLAPQASFRSPSPIAASASCSGGAPPRHWSAMPMESPGGAAE